MGKKRTVYAGVPAILFLTRVNGMRRRELPFELREDLCDEYRQMLGAVYLARKILRVQKHGSFPELLPHLRYIYADTHTGAKIGQASQSAANDEVANKTFELLMAALLMTFAKRVKLADPLRADPANPDVLFDLRRKRWALACKVVTSTHRQTYLENLDKAAQQIRKSSASVGIICISLKNQLPHERTFGLDPDGSTNEVLRYVVHKDAREPARMLLNYCSRNIGPMFEEPDFGKELEVRGVFTDARVARHILHYVHSIALIGSSAEPRHQPNCFFYGVQLEKNQRLTTLAHTLTRAAQWR